MTQMEQYIRQYAASIGLNPDIVMRTVLNEGGASSLQPAGYARQSLIQEQGGQEPSYGPFQMNMKYLGKRALEAGFDPRDPAQAFNVAKFAMDEIKRDGLTQWHGWKGDRWAAHGGQPSGETVATPTTDTASGSYDPRRDTPTYGRPTGEKVSQYALEHPVGPEGDDVTTSPANIEGNPYALPAGAGTQANPLITEAKEKPWNEKFGEGLAGGLGKITGKFDYNVQTPVPGGLARSTPAPMIDPNTSQNQRMMLAYALQRLNAGKLA